MLNILSSIKGKFTSILLGLVGILAVLLSLSKGSNERLKRKAAQQEKSDLEAAKKQQDKATEAYIKGITNEQDNTSPRSYDFHD